MSDEHELIVLIKHDLAIAESGNAKREAYISAATEIVAYRKQTGCTVVAIASAIDRDRSFVTRMITWHNSDFKAETPFLMDEKATTRAAVSHTKKVLNESTPEEVAAIIADLPDEALAKVEKAASDESVTRVVYPDRPKPTHAKAAQKAKAKDTERLKANPNEAVVRFLSTLGQGRATARMIVQGYEDFTALVEDEDLRTIVRDQLVAFRADIDIALGEAISGGFEAAVERLLAADEVG